MGIIGDQFAHSAADDLNIYYEQFPCVGTPKFQSRKYTNESWCFLRGHGRAEGLSLRILLHTAQASETFPLSSDIDPRWSDQPTSMLGHFPVEEI